MDFEISSETPLVWYCTRGRLNALVDYVLIVLGVTQVGVQTPTINSYASRQDYYGVLKDIIELNYEDVGKIVLFECDWYNSEGNSTGL